MPCRRRRQLGLVVGRVAAEDARRASSAAAFGSVTSATVATSAEPDPPSAQVRDAPAGPRLPITLPRQQVDDAQPVRRRGDDRGPAGGHQEVPDRVVER